MLQRLASGEGYLWSVLDPETNLPANGYLFSDGNALVAIHPPHLDERSREHIRGLGGISKVVLLSGEREPQARALAKDFGASLVQPNAHEEELFPGAIAFVLKHQRASEFAVFFRESGTLVTDALAGVPAGRLSLYPQNAYGDAHAAALALRTLLRRNPAAVLTARGWPVFANAYAALYQALFEVAGAEVHRINLDEIEYRFEGRDEHAEQPSLYECDDAEIGWFIGAQKLGYRVSRLQPGKRFCPMHAHAQEEELFFVIDGTPSVRTPYGVLHCRKGDFVALPTGETGAHQLVNESAQPATVLLLSRVEETEICYYPDSGKLLADSAVPLVENSRSRLVAASPQLDYFAGEEDLSGASPPQISGTTEQ